MSGIRLAAAHPHPGACHRLVRGLVGASRKFCRWALVQAHPAQQTCESATHLFIGGQPQNEG